MAISRSLPLIAVLLMTDSLHFVFARLLLPHLPPTTSAFYVLAIAALEMGLLGMVQKRFHLRVLIQNLGFFLLVGFLVGTSTTLNYTAMAFIDPGAASLLGKTSILFSLGLGIFWLKDRLTRAQGWGALVAIVGVFIVTFQPGDYVRLGSLMILISSLMYALHAAIVKRSGEQIPFVEFFFFRLLCTAGFLFLYTLGAKSLVWPQSQAWLLLFLVGTVDVVISRSLYYGVLRKVKISILSIVLTMSPVLVVAWSWLLFHIVPSIQQIVGGAAVMLGVLIVTAQKHR